MESCAGDIHKCTSSWVGAMARPWLCWGCVNDQACLRLLDKTREHLHSRPVSPGPASDLRQMSLSAGLSFLDCKPRKISLMSYCAKVLTVSTGGPEHTQETLDKKSRDGPDCVWTTRNLSLSDFGKGQPRPRQDGLAFRLPVII